VNVKIEPFKIDHLNDCAELYRFVFNGEPWNDEWTLETAQKRLLEMIDTPGFVGFIGKDQDKIIGLIMGYNEQSDTEVEFYLKEMCVHPDYQQSGYGSQLLSHLKQALMAMGVYRIYLLTLKGGSTEAFYRKNGFRSSSEMILMSCVF
jgi:ribosomal protein S18 acetylase RimI-like enzyme